MELEVKIRELELVDGGKRAEDPATTESFCKSDEEATMNDVSQDFEEDESLMSPEMLSLNETK